MNDALPLEDSPLRSIEAVEQGLMQVGYIASRPIAAAIYMAHHLRKPILVEGPAGVGKTELAKSVAAWLNLKLIRMQCYEGLDESKSLYEWKYGKQLLYTQILKDKISEVLVGAKGLTEAVDRIAAQDEVFFSERFVLPRPLLKAISSEQPSV
ncbi:MAG TPA: AAA family ATPase, partial [Rhodopila sp.]|nr:AAA family ATPase [Rhodopila sp.]